MDKLTEAAEDLWWRIQPEGKTRRVVVSLVVAVLVSKTVCYLLVDLVTVLLGGRGLPSPPFPPCFRFSLAPAIVQNNKLTSIYSVIGRGRANKERKSEQMNG